MQTKDTLIHSKQFFVQIWGFSQKAVQKDLWSLLPSTEPASQGDTQAPFCQPCFPRDLWSTVPLLLTTLTESLRKWELNLFSVKLFLMGQLYKEGALSVFPYQSHFHKFWRKALKCLLVLVPSLLATPKTRGLFLQSSPPLTPRQPVTPSLLMRALHPAICPIQGLLWAPGASKGIKRGKGVWALLGRSQCFSSCGQRPVCSYFQSIMDW